MAHLPKFQADSPHLHTIASTTVCETAAEVHPKQSSFHLIETFQLSVNSVYSVKPLQLYTCREERSKCWWELES